MAGPRLDEVPDNVFALSSRINSTWGGNLVDMVRCEIILHVMHEEQLVANAATVGTHLLAQLTELVAQHSDTLSNARGRGLMCAFDCASEALRDHTLERCRRNGSCCCPAARDRCACARRSTSRRRTSTR